MEVILHDSIFFLHCTLAGMLLLFLYDGLRIGRVIFKHPGWLVFWQDFFFLSLAGVGIFLLFYVENNGEIRLYAWVALLLGMLGYHFGPSGLIVYVACFVPKKIQGYRLRREVSKREQRK